MLPRNSGKRRTTDFRPLTPDQAVDHKLWLFIRVSQTPCLLKYDDSVRDLLTIFGESSDLVRQ